MSWFIFGGITLAVAILGGALLRNHPSEKGLTAIGAAQNTPAPSKRPAGLDTLATRPAGLDTLATRPAGLEKQATRPPGLQWGRVYRSFAVWHLGLVYVSFGFSYMIYMTFFAKRLIAEGGYTSAEAGGLFMAMGWVSILCGPIWGTVSDVIGRKGALIGVYLIHAVSFTLFGLSATSAGFTVSAILFGLSAWSIPAIMSAACGDMLGPRLAPAALGFITLFFGVGQALGPSVAGAMADAFGTFGPAYLLAAAVALLGAAAASLLRPATPAPEHLLESAEQ
jgi:MFS family permease